MPARFLLLGYCSMKNILYSRHVFRESEVAFLSKNLIKKHENKHTWALTVFPPILILLVANSTPIVDFDSTSNSFRVNRDSKQDFPTPESPVKTILYK